MSIGKVREFLIKSGNWSSYIERLEMYFIVNKVADDLKLPTLISFMGEEAYELLSTLASPLKPSDLSYTRAVEILAAHLQPKPSILAERYKFRQRRQLSHESIADYVTELKKLSKYCECQSTLDDNLRDQLVCGLNSEMIRQKLFAEENLSYNRAVGLALSLEAAERDASAVEPCNREATEGLHKLKLDNCRRCKGKHRSSDCPFKDYVCSGYGEIGHLRRTCQRITRREGSADSAGGGGRYGSPSYSNGQPTRGFSGRTTGSGARRGQRGAARGNKTRMFYKQDDDEVLNNDRDVENIRSNMLFEDETDECDDEPMYQMSLSNYKPPLGFIETTVTYNGVAELRVRKEAVPIFCRARPLPYALRERVDAELDAMLKTGVIEPVDHSDWATPLVVVRKADGGLRICADYKVTLNKVLAIDRFPIPKMEDLFSDLSGNMYFTKLDLSQAYNQVVLSENSKNYTVINTHRGLFKYCRLVYGLSSSPGIFQKLMVNLFKNTPNVSIFYDDILIRNRDLPSHLKSIEEVLKILESNGLRIKKSKCEFLAREVKYLGFIIDRSGVRVDRDKVEAIATMPHPRNISEVKSFLGMVNFYGKFIKNLSMHLAPLYELLKKGRHWKWGPEQNRAFKQVKNFLCSAGTLEHFDLNKESVLTIDASARGLGAVLAQRAPGGGGGERVVAYASRSLTAHEVHYSQIHKEALAIVFAVDKFHQYLYGRQFVLRTDHKPLVSIFGSNIGIPSAAASRLQRWAIKLSAYDFTIEYIKTDNNTADVLSRLIYSQKNEASCDEVDLPEQTYLHFSTEALLLDYNVLKRETQRDPILGRVLSYIVDGWPSDIEIKELRPYFNRRHELYYELGCIMWGHRVVIPSSCHKKVLLELHDSHMGIVKTKSLARSYVWWPGIDEAVEAECRACDVCASVADALPAHSPRSWPWPSRPWSRLHIDFLGPISNSTYLIIVDSCSKWIEAIKMTRTTAQAVIAVLRKLWSQFGLPKQTVSDNGPPFTSLEFQNFLKHNGIEHIFTAPYHPASNGAAESAVKICKRTIKKALKQRLDVDVALSRFLLTYRNTEHATTEDSPAKILQGRSLRMRLDNLKPERESRVASRQARSVNNVGGSERMFDAGAHIWYREFRGSDKWQPGTIIKRLGNTDYSVRTGLGKEIHRHIDQLRRRVIDSNNSGSDVSTKLEINKKSRKSLAVPTSNVEAPDKADCGSEGERNIEDVSIPGGHAIESEIDQPVVMPTNAQRSPDLPNVSPNKSNTATSVVVESRPVRSRKRPVRYGFDEPDE